MYTREGYPPRIYPGRLGYAQFIPGRLGYVQFIPRREEEGPCIYPGGRKRDPVYTQEGRRGSLYIPSRYTLPGVYALYILSLYMSRPVHVRHAVIDCSRCAAFQPCLVRGASFFEEKDSSEVLRTGEKRKKDGLF